MYLSTSSWPWSHACHERQFSLNDDHGNVLMTAEKEAYVFLMLCCNVNIRCGAVVGDMHNHMMQLVR